MADNQLLLGDDDVGGGDDVFVYTGGDQDVPRDVRRVRIAANVDAILARTFQGCQQLTEVEGHDDEIKKIEEYAFHGCRRLRRVKMAGLIEIESYAFNCCTALSELDFDRLEIIGGGAFAHCKSLRSIDIPSIRRVARRAFHSCGLTDVVFGEKLERIEEFAFDDCTFLRRIVIPLKDNLIDCISVFYRCQNLSRVNTLDGGIHRTISFLHMESWRNEMEDEISSINQTLLNTPEKTEAIQQWITRVRNRIEHYKSEK